MESPRDDRTRSSRHEIKRKHPEPSGTRRGAGWLHWSVTPEPRLDAQTHAGAGAALTPRPSSSNRPPLPHRARPRTGRTDGRDGWDGCPGALFPRHLTEAVAATPRLPPPPLSPGKGRSRPAATVRPARGGPGPGSACLPSEDPQPAFPDAIASSPGSWCALVVSADPPERLLPWSAPAQINELASTQNTRAFDACHGDFPGGSRILVREPRTGEPPAGSAGVWRRLCGGQGAQTPRASREIASKAATDRFPALRN